MNAGTGKQMGSRIRRALRWDELSPVVRKVLAAVVGGSVLLAGFAMVFLPGPAFIVIPLGLAILATEFAWARHYLLKAREWFDRTRARARRSWKKAPPPVIPPEPRPSSSPSTAPPVFPAQR